jgi:hypothetical protein
MSAMAKLLACDFHEAVDTGTMCARQLDHSGAENIIP